MKSVEVTINPTEVRSVKYINAFSKKPGEKISLSVKSEASIKLNPTNPVVALVIVKVIVEDPDKCIQMDIETITGVNVSTFIDNLDQFIKEKYLPVIIMSANEKVRAVSAMMGTPIKIPNPRFGAVSESEAGGLTQ
ncbi:MAG: hypothetical protein HDT13_03065 [Butyrivibrio sp.]|nr:hypothetical protein [Butyrivibrio sp.]